MKWDDWLAMLVGNMASIATRSLAERTRVGPYEIPAPRPRRRRTAAGVIKVLDFGLASVWRRDSPDWWKEFVAHALLRAVFTIV